VNQDLDAAAASVLDLWLSQTAQPVHEQPLEVSRNARLVGPDVTGPGPELSSVVDTSVGDVPVRVYRPEAGEGLPVLVYAHGGGWTLLSIDSADVLCRHLAAGAGCVVVSVGYRLAPEHPFPAAFDDVWHVASWAARGGLGWVPPALALGGDSAGGNLSAGVATHARDTGAFRIDFQLLLYPVLSTDLTRPSMLRLGPDPRFRLAPETMRWFWGNYLGGELTSDDPRAVPMAASSFADLPATLVVTAGHDPLKDDGAAYGSALQAAGVGVEHFEAATLPHGFAMMLGAVPAAREAFAHVVRRVRAAMHPLPHLAEEFKKRPFGRHSEELQRLLNRMRSVPMAGKHFLFMSRSQREWVLGRYSDGPPYRPIIDWDVAFGDLEDAEWYVFKQRWHQMFGTELVD
jgi:acetyl esterase